MKPRRAGAARSRADGLRQLARSLKPGEAGDPLAYDWAVDPELGRLFDVEELPSRSASERPPPERSWLDFFVARAYAADQPLDRWVPTRDELAAYEPRIGELLQKTRGERAAARRRSPRRTSGSTATWCRPPR